jgi:demethylmenaquinone methyltransferase / 2-methoxy-6-polyprenyl-1,4-benzoquinol methylase
MTPPRGAGPDTVRPSLRESLSNPDAKGRYVRRLFSTIADRYDFITVLLSYGQDRRWKRRLSSLANARPGIHALDLACGTGDITFELSTNGASATGLDITPRMLELAAAKSAESGSDPGLTPRWVAGDMMALPFASARFDVVTTGYGIRNVPILTVALSEIHRVLKPGGLFLSLDFNRPSNGLVRAVYLSYLTVVGSALGFALHGDPDTYRYIPESIRRYPGARAVCVLAREQGFVSCEYIPVLGGLMAIHRAVRGG